MRTAVDRQFLDWTTAAIGMRQQLIDAGDCHNAVMSVFDPVEAYQILPSPNSRIITKALPSRLGETRLCCENKWSILKKLAAGLRWAYLNQRLVIDILTAPPHDETRCESLLMRTFEQSFVITDAFSVRAQPCVPVVLQGGAPADWYVISNWHKMRPVSIHSANPLVHPLSAPGYFDPIYEPLLRDLGARRTGPGSWEPPLATTTEDLQRFVQATKHGQRGAA